MKTGHSGTVGTGSVRSGSSPHRSGGERAGGPSGLGCTARLGIRGLVPLIGLVLVASSLTITRLTTADHARAIEHDVDRLGRLVHARSAVRSERVSMEALLQARA